MNNQILVDDCDKNLLTEYKWYVDKRTKYVITSTSIQPFNKRLRLHRIITNCPDDKVVDHINRNPLDNRRENLRICTIAENSRNTGIPSHNKSGYKGVYYDRSVKVYKAAFMHEGKVYRLGTFTDPAAAATAYQRGVKKYHKEFAAQ